MKLSLHEAEVTISLSDSKEVHLASRTIEIKPVEVISDEAAYSQDMDLREEAAKTREVVDKYKAEIEQLEKQRRELKEQTEQEIEKKKQEWEAEKKTWIEQAREEGYQAGFTSGEKDAREKYKEYVSQANSLVTAAQKDYEKTVAASDEAIVQLAMQAAEKIIVQQIDVEPGAFLNIIKAAIKEIDNQSEVAIYVHPGNYEFVLQQKDELKRILEDNLKLFIYANENLKDNACLINHPFGQIDASVDSQLEEIRTSLLEVIGGE